MKLLRLPILLILLCSVLPLNAQDRDQPESVPQNQTYEITSVTYTITGKTQKRMLDRKLDFPLGTVFNSKEELTKYMENLRQKLINFQFFSDITVFYEAQTDPTLESGHIPILVTISVTDELTMIVLPGPKYNSNDGLTVKLKYKENNFLGSMESVSANFEYNQNHNDETGENYPELGLDMSFSYPFMLSTFSSDASLNSEIVFQNIATDDFLFKFNAVAGLNVELYKNRTVSINTGAKQGVFYNQQDSDYNLYEGDKLYYQENAYVNAGITLLDAGRWGKLTYSPEASLLYNWDPDGIEEQNTDLIGLRSSFSHSLSFGQVNYSGLFRDGLTASAGNSYTYNIYRNTHSFSTTVLVCGYKRLFKYLGVNTRLGFFSYLETKADSTTFIGDGDENRGEYIRGIRNHRIKTDIGFYASVDFPIHVFSLNAKKIMETYFPNSKFMNTIFGSLGFDFIVSPFFDAMLTHYNNAFYAKPSSVPQGDRYFSPKDGWYAAGADFIIVPHKFKSQNIRIGIGWDLEEVLKQKSLTASATRDGESIYEIVLSLSLEY